MTANTVAADGIDNHAQSEGQQRAAVFAEALSTFFQPTVDVAQTIRAVVAQQQALNQEIDALNQKMGVAAVLPSQQQQQQLDQYVQKLRLAKQRVEMLSKILIAVKGRLWRVHSTLQTKTRALDTENQQLAAQIVSEQQEQHQQHVEVVSQAAPQTTEDGHRTTAARAADTMDSSTAEVAPRSPLMRNDTVAPHAADETTDENAVAQQPEGVLSHDAVAVTLHQEESAPAEAVTKTADVPCESTADAVTVEGNTSAEIHTEPNSANGDGSSAAGPLHDDAAKEQTATEEQPVDAAPLSSEPQDAEEAAVVAAPQSNKAQQPSAKKSGKGKKR